MCVRSTYIGSFALICFVIGKMLLANRISLQLIFNIHDKWNFYLINNSRKLKAFKYRNGTSVHCLCIVTAQCAHGCVFSKLLLIHPINKWMGRKECIRYVCTHCTHQFYTFSTSKWAKWNRSTRSTVHMFNVMFYLCLYVG